MRAKRGLVLLLAFSAAAGAALLVQKAARIPAGVTAMPKAETVDLLVASRAIAIGETVGKPEMRWQRWPSGAVPPGGITRPPTASPATFPLDPAPARIALLEGEPISPAKLARPEHGSVLAGLVAPGMRAVSVPIREESAAGGFIQPNDRVDVIARRPNGESGREPARSEILLRGVKVLAIGKTLQGKATAAGRTATLELTPGEASRLTGAQGDIALALIGSADGDGEGRPGGAFAEPAREIRIMKYGRSADRSGGQ